MAIDDQPSPQARSAMRAGGSASRRAWTSGMAGSHSEPRMWWKSGRFVGGLGLAQIGTVVRPGHAAAVLEGGHDLRAASRIATAIARAVGVGVGQAELVEQDLAMAGRERVSTPAVVGLVDRRPGCRSRPAARATRGHSAPGGRSELASSGRGLGSRRIEAPDRGRVGRPCRPPPGRRRLRPTRTSRPASASRARTRRSASIGVDRGCGLCHGVDLAGASTMRRRKGRGCRNRRTAAT